MTVGNYSVRSIGNYVREMRFIFEYYPDVSPADLTAEKIEVYICYIKKTFNSGFFQMSAGCEASLEDVKNWFRTYYGAANAVLVIAGDVKADEVYEKVKKYFGNIRCNGQKEWYFINVLFKWTKRMVFIFIL